MKIVLNQLEKNADVKNKKLHSSPELYDKVVVLRLKISSITAKTGR
jgi:hypothetical protein